MPDDLDALLSEPLPGAAAPAGDEDEELEPETDDSDEFSMFASDVFDDELSPEEKVEALRSAILALTGPKLEM